MRAPTFDGSQACAGADLELFFPTVAGPAATRATDRAKELCAGCRFLQPCGDYAVWAQGVPGRYVSGVWGGTTDGERLRIRQAQRRAAA